MSNIERPKLSFVVPVATDRHIQETVLSYEKCPGSDKCELLIVRNQASQPVVEITDELSRLNPNIIIIDTSERSIPKSRNMGVLSAQSDWIVHADSDITFNRLFIQSILTQIEENPETDIIVPQILRCEGKSFIQRMLSAHFTLLSRREKPPVHTPGLVIKSELHDQSQLGLYDQRVTHGEDNEFRRRIKETHNVVFTKKAAVFHKTDSDSKTIKQHFRYGQSKSIISRVQNGERTRILKERLTKVLFVPKFLDHLEYGLEMAAFESMVGTISSLGFWYQEIRFLLGKDKSKLIKEQD